MTSRTTVETSLKWRKDEFCNDALQSCKPHSFVVADYWKSVGLVTGNSWTCYTVKRIVCRWTWPFDRSSHFCCQRLHWSLRTTEDVKIFLVVRHGWQLRIPRQLVTEEVRERETHGDISSQESVSLRLLWDLNAYTVHQHSVLAICVPTRRNCIYIHIERCQPLL